MCTQTEGWTIWIVCSSSEQWWIWGQEIYPFHLIGTACTYKTLKLNIFKKKSVVGSGTSFSRGTKVEHFHSQGYRVWRYEFECPALEMMLDLRKSWYQRAPSAPIMWWSVTWEPRFRRGTIDCLDNITLRWYNHSNTLLKFMGDQWFLTTME